VGDIQSWIDGKDYTSIFWTGKFRKGLSLSNIDIQPVSQFGSKKVA